MTRKGQKFMHNNDTAIVTLVKFVDSHNRCKDTDKYK